MAYIDVNTPVIDRITLPSGNTYYIADRELRDVVDNLTGVDFIVAWDGTAEPVVANIPEGIKVTYNDVEYTGTLDADNADLGAFYLVKSSTQVGSGDVFDEYVPVLRTGAEHRSWEKIGDTQIDLSNVVTAVSLTKVTDTAIGTDATFTITQPTISLSAENSSAAGRVGGVTDLGSPTTQSAVKSVSPTTSKLATSTASKATAATSQTTATGAGTSSSTNTDWLKGVSVSNGVLTIGAATMNTQTTTQQTFSDVTVATGSVANDATGASVVTGVSVGDTFNAVTGYESVTTKYVEGSASGANTEWNSKDSVTVLTNQSDVSVTKG